MPMTQIEKINVLELIKDCPKGMELDCILFNKPVKYGGINDDDVYSIIIIVENGEYFYLTKEGYLYDIPNSKCIIFPKGKTTWDGFVPPCKFKDGDILSYQHSEFKNRSIYIYMYHCRMNTTYYVAVSGSPDSEFKINDKEGHALNSYNDTVRLATEEEKQKLFQAIKDNGYKWNAETKTLEKLIKPEFKVGDKIRHKINMCKGDIITEIKDTNYILNDKTHMPFIFQDEYELVPNKFDISNLKPFDQVLVRDNNEQEWTISFFGCYNGLELYKYSCIHGVNYAQCIPYKGNEHLLDKTNNCDEFYKTW